MTDFLKRYKWKVVGVAVGAIAGFAYWYYIGCNSGTCPIQSNWHTSTLYGGLIGFVFVNSPKKKNSKESRVEHEKQKDRE